MNDRGEFVDYDEEIDARVHDLRDIILRNACASLPISQEGITEMFYEYASERRGKFNKALRLVIWGNKRNTLRDMFIEFVFKSKLLEKKLTEIAQSDERKHREQA